MLLFSLFLTAGMAWNAVLVYWDFHPERRPRRMTRAYVVLPEWGLAMLIGGVPLLVAMWGLALQSMRVEVPIWVLGASAGWIALQFVFVLIPVILFDQPSFLIPKWRRVEMREERTSRRLSKLKDKP